MAKLILTIHPDEHQDDLRESLESAFNVAPSDGRHRVLVNRMFVYYITGEYELVDDDEVRTRV